jgi:hypothetical protein
MAFRKLLLLAGPTLAILTLAYSAWRTLFGDWVPSEGRLAAALRRDRELDDLFRRLHASDEVIQQIHQDLIEQRLSFAQAVAAIRAEHASRPREVRPFLGFCPGHTAEERLCWLVLGHLRISLSRDPRRASALPRIRVQALRYLAGLGADTGDFDTHWRALAWRPPAR